jgi:tetratricopeptide (TPR) repeat protein
MRDPVIKKFDFLNPENKASIPVTVIVLAFVWGISSIIIKSLTNFESTLDQYYLLLSIGSILVTFLLGSLIHAYASIDEKAQQKYEKIMNSLFIDDDGEKKYSGLGKERFNRAEYLRLKRHQHLDIIHFSSKKEDLKLEELEMILEHTDPVNEPNPYSRCIEMCCKILYNDGKYERAIEFCENGLNALPKEEKLATGVVQMMLGISLKKAGKDTDLAVDYLKKAIETIPDTYVLESINAKKALLRLHFMKDGTIPDKSELEKIHEEINILSKEATRTKDLLWSWKVSETFESYYDLYSSFLASEGQMKWAIRYSFAAVAIAEARTGIRASSYSVSHLTKFLMKTGDFENAKILLSQKEQYVQQTGSSRGWIPYNLARCHFGLKEFDHAVNCYKHTITAGFAEADTKLKAYIGLHYAYLRLGEDTKAQESKVEAEKLSKQFGFKPRWIEPDIQDEMNSVENIEEWKINQESISWHDAHMRAVKELGLETNAYGKKGTELHDKTKEIYDSFKSY